jgi:hypothetical protein
LLSDEDVNCDGKDEEEEQRRLASKFWLILHLDGRERCRERLEVNGG